MKLDEVRSLKQDALEVVKTIPATDATYTAWLDVDHGGHSFSDKTVFSASSDAHAKSAGVEYLNYAADAFARGERSSVRVRVLSYAVGHWSEDGFTSSADRLVFDSWEKPEQS